MYLCPSFLLFMYRRTHCRNWSRLVNEMDQWIKAVATNFNNLSSILELTWREERTNFHELSSFVPHSPHCLLYAIAYVLKHAHTMCIIAIDSNFKHWVVLTVCCSIRGPQFNPQPWLSVTLQSSLYLLISTGTHYTCSAQTHAGEMLPCEMKANKS